MRRRQLRGARLRARRWGRRGLVRVKTRVVLCWSPFLLGPWCVQLCTCNEFTYIYFYMVPRSEEGPRSEQLGLRQTLRLAFVPKPGDCRRGLPVQKNVFLPRFIQTPCSGMSKTAIKANGVCSTSMLLMLLIINNKWFKCQPAKNPSPSTLFSELISRTFHDYLNQRGSP